MTIKLCTDCRHAEREWDTNGIPRWWCMHEAARVEPEPDYVTGAPQTPYQLRCREMRHNDVVLRGLPSGGCGPDGRYWEAKE